MMCFVCDMYIMYNYHVAIACEAIYESMSHFLRQVMGSMSHVSLVGLTYQAAEGIQPGHQGHSESKTDHVIHIHNV